MKKYERYNSDNHNWNYQDVMHKLMKTTAIYILLVMILGSFTLKEDFLSEQKKFERVRIAIKEKEQLITKKLKGFDLKLNNFNILIIAYKDNDDLELYGKNRSDKEYIKLETYKICSRSGELGPKKSHGDNQVPERV